MGGQPRARAEALGEAARGRRPRQPSSERCATIVQSSAPLDQHGPGAARRRCAPSTMTASPASVAAACRTVGGRGRRRSSGCDVGGRQAAGPRRRATPLVGVDSSAGERPSVDRGDERRRGRRRCPSVRQSGAPWSVRGGASARRPRRRPRPRRRRRSMADPRRVERRLRRSSPSARRPRTGTSRASSGDGRGRAERRRSAVGDGPRRGASDRRRRRRAPSARSRRPRRRRPARRRWPASRRDGIGGRHLAQRGADRAELLDPGLERGVGRDAGRLLGGGGAVEVGGGELVEVVRVGHGRGRGFVALRLDGRAVGPGSPGSSSCGAAAPGRGRCGSGRCRAGCRGSRRSRRSRGRRGRGARPGPGTPRAARRGRRRWPAGRGGRRSRRSPVRADLARRRGRRAARATGAALAAAQLVEAGVGRHPVGPGGEGGAAVEAPDAAGDGDQGLLGGVEGVGLVAGQPAAHGVDPVVVAAQQRVEGGAVALLGGADERLVVGLGSDGARLLMRPVSVRTPGPRRSSTGVAAGAVALVGDPDRARRRPRRPPRSTVDRCRPRCRRRSRPGSPQPSRLPGSLAGDVELGADQSLVGLSSSSSLELAALTRAETTRPTPGLSTVMSRLS